MTSSVAGQHEDESKEHEQKAQSRKGLLERWPKFMEASSPSKEQAGLAHGDASHPAAETVFMRRKDQEHSAASH